MNAALQPHREVLLNGITGSLVVPEPAPRASKPRALRALILPDWQGGHTPYIRRMAQIFGERVDAEPLIFNPYPEGIHPKTYDGEGRALVAGLLADRPGLRATIRMAIDQAEPLWRSRSAPLILIGFCFGGSLAFEAVRAGAEVAMAFSIHGTPVLASEGMEAPGDRSRDGVELHYIGGGGDRLVPDRSILAFRDELERSNRQGSLTLLAGEGHSFTKEEVGRIGPLSRYSQSALQRSLALTHALTEGLRPPAQGPSNV